ncbi:hypothetical protein D3C86_2107200 [compost metagenome]
MPTAADQQQDGFLEASEIGEQQVQRVSEQETRSGQQRCPDCRAQQVEGQEALGRQAAHADREWSGYA